ncbi:MAG: serine hydrolase domain-containing protein [Hyphomicrobiaceae bacterium]
MEGHVEDRILRTINRLMPQAGETYRRRSATPLGARQVHLATPGVNICVIEGREIDWARGFGSRSSITGGEVSENTPFQAGSISKPVFALAIAKLVQDGTLDLDKDVNDYLRTWRVPNTDGWQPCVTLRQLLSHSAATTVHGFPGYPRDGPRPTLPQILDGDYPANTSAVEVAGLPGIHFQYSGGGTSIAQQVMVDVLDQPFHEIMQDLVLGQVGMKNSTFDQNLSAGDMAERVAAGHLWCGVQVSGGWHVYPEMGAAGLWTTAEDLALLGIEFMGALKGQGSKLGLKPEVAQEMLTPQPDRQELEEGNFVGLGWFISQTGSEFNFGHDGGNHGFLARLKILPDEGKGIAILVNSVQGWPLLDEVERAVREEYNWPKSRQPDQTVAMQSGAGFDGMYSSAHHKATVSAAEDGLSFSFDDQNPLPMCPICETEFVARFFDSSVVFHPDEAGGMASLTVKQNGTLVELKRVAKGGDE